MSEHHALNLAIRMLRESFEQAFEAHRQELRRELRQLLFPVWVGIGLALLVGVVGWFR